MYTRFLRKGAWYPTWVRRRFPMPNWLFELALKHEWGSFYELWPWRD